MKQLKYSLSVLSIILLTIPYFLFDKIHREFKHIDRYSFSVRSARSALKKEADKYLHTEFPDSLLPWHHINAGFENLDNYYNNFYNVEIHLMFSNQSIDSIKLVDIRDNLMKIVKTNMKKSLNYKLKVLRISLQGYNVVDYFLRYEYQFDFKNDDFNLMKKMVY